MAYEELKIRLNSMIKKAIQDIQEELYPKKLGEAVMMQASEQRLVVIAEYQGYGRALQELGVDIKELESIINTEVTKILEGKY